MCRRNGVCAVGLGKVNPRAPTIALDELVDKAAVKSRVLDPVLDWLRRKAPV
ncbi:MAG: hypothetical protein HY908_18530 [Myxococcales bacterium]|nr:hypothetical protein [Myxococcales bacterium]